MAMRGSAGKTGIGLTLAASMCVAWAAWSDGPSFRRPPQAPDDVAWQSSAERLATAMPAWSRALAASDRFRLVLHGEAVLDRETGLVWERGPDSATVGWADAQFFCYGTTVGQRKGWRLPTAEELMSLVAPGRSAPALPQGAPFTGILPDVYWTATTIAGTTGSAYGVFFNDGTLFDQTKSTLSRVWCVRGGHGHDGF